MKNFIMQGDTITLSAPYVVASGAGALVGSFFGVAVKDLQSAEVGEFRITGVFSITCLSTDTGSVGTKMYWDNTNKRLTTTLTSNTFVGALTKAKTNGQTVAEVRLNGVSV